MFINVETTNGLLQFAAYNEHNAYYAHEVKLVLNIVIKGVRIDYEINRRECCKS